MKQKIGEIQGKPLILTNSEDTIQDHELLVKYNYNNGKISDVKKKEANGLMSILDIDSGSSNSSEDINVLIEYTDGTHDDFLGHIYNNGMGCDKPNQSSSVCRMQTYASINNAEVTWPGYISSNNDVLYTRADSKMMRNTIIIDSLEVDLSKSASIIIIGIFPNRATIDWVNSIIESNNALIEGVAVEEFGTNKTKWSIGLKNSIFPERPNPGEDFNPDDYLVEFKLYEDF